jgi:hypothetical protein
LTLIILGFCLYVCCVIKSFNLVVDQPCALLVYKTGDHLNIPVLYTSRAHGWSTTKLKDLITQETYKKNPKIVNAKSKKA